MATDIFIINLVHLVCFFVAWGVTVWVFISGIIMFGVLPRHMLGNLRSKIFPLYFSIMVMCSSGLLATSFWSSLSNYELGYLLASFLLNFISLHVFAPIMVQVVKQRHKLERQLSIGKQIGWRENRSLPKPISQLVSLNRKFHAIHATSALAYMLSVGCFAMYSCYLAAKIKL